ncbi:MAG TPA: hypothetical protein VES90_08325, partial [Candidatus Eisenbacteria bacterium]|nr:hypothetical protein [Candidatus Eisenbacteria bacterium]
MAVLALGLMLLVPRLQPPTGTLVVVVSGRTAGSLQQSALMIHKNGQWVALGDLSGAVPAAPAEREVAALSIPTGKYDGVRLGGALQDVAITITAGQVEPLLL